MDAFLERMINERNELNNKLIKLSEFITGDVCKNLDLRDRGDLADQHYFMTGYLNVLNRRIETLTKKVNPNG